MPFLYHLSNSGIQLNIRFCRLKYHWWKNFYTANFVLRIFEMFWAELEKMRQLQPLPPNSYLYFKKMAVLPVKLPISWLHSFISAASTATWIWKLYWKFRFWYYIIELEWFSTYFKKKIHYFKTLRYISIKQLFSIHFV